MSAIGYPLLGDRRYGARGRLPPAASAEVTQAIQQFPRQALHACELGFHHPGSGDWMQFSAALPEDMQQLLQLLIRDTEQSADG
jgi:23S rRNA pseudouridine1911/1915/1917 synthase